MESKFHQPVMVREVMVGFKLDKPPSQRPRIIDATMGTAGHTLELIKKGARVLGIEKDPEMLALAEKRLKKACPTFENYGRTRRSYLLSHGNFRDIDLIAEQASFDRVEGILFDLGVSSPQLISSERGFSFSNREAVLDMRIDPESQGVTAADLINGLRTDHLTNLFSTTLHYGFAKKLVVEIIARRGQAPIKKVGDFLEICERVLPEKGKLHPATKAFLALRMAVNSELENLEEALPKAVELLKPGGRLAVISFHSGEDKIVKNFYREMEKKQTAVVITKEPLRPGLSEVQKNPRSRSAKLRILEKI